MAFDEHMEPEIQRVLDTSAILEITEFEVFRLSYDRWFGTPPKDELLEPIFSDYMFRMVVPSWVNHFTRKVMKRYKEGRLDPASYGISPKPFSNARARMGIQIFILIVSLITCLVLLAEGITDYYDITGLFR